MATRDERRRERRRKRQAQEQARTRAREVQAAAHPERVRGNMPRIGPPGIPTELYVVARFDSPGESEEDDRARLNDTREREFQVFAHLSTALSLSPRDISLSLDPEAGSSLLTAPPNAVRMTLHTPWGGVTLHRNETGEVSAAEFRCRARSRQEALEFYSEHVAPFLDHISYKLDVPLHVASVGWADDLNKVSGAHCIAPYRPVPLVGLTGSFDAALRPFLALYREAISNPSVYYQFLCLCKILEGTFGRPSHQEHSHSVLCRICKGAGERGITVNYSIPTVPQLDALTAAPSARAFEGRSIEEAYHSYLRPEFRNALAHFAAKGKEPLQVSSYVTSTRLEGALELARLCARLAIRTLEECLAQVPSR